MTNRSAPSVRRFHGMSLWSWWLVQHQGALRPAVGTRDKERVLKVVGGQGFVYFTASARMAAVYAGGKPASRLPVARGNGRWELPWGVANQDGVVVVANFEGDELVYTHRPNSHEEYVTDQPIPIDRLRALAFIPAGENVETSLSRRRKPPAPSAEDRERLEAVGKDATLVFPGALIADLEAAGAPHSDSLSAEQVAANGGDWRSMLSGATST